MNAKVVVTGIGWLTPLGWGVRDVWDRLLAGHSGIGPISRFDASAFPVRIAGELKDYNPERWLDSRESKRLDRFTQYALAAAQMAVDDAGLAFGAMDPYRAGVIAGSGAGGMESIEAGQTALFQKGPLRIPPLSIPKMMINAASSNIARRFGLRGSTCGVALACATGAAAIAQAAEQIALGRADVMLAGGSEASITPLSVAAFSACGALSKSENEPARVCRPFDLGRDGFVMSEGAGILVLESAAHASARGARVYAELAGTGMSTDLHHITAPDPDGAAAAKAIEFALRDAGESAQAVGYVNAHGTGTPLNDPMEAKALRRALGEDTAAAVSSTKSMTGHLLGAAGAVEAAITALAVMEGVAPPTINVENPDPECAMNIVRDRPLPLPGLRVALSNAFAFGGHNVVLAFRKAS